MWIGSMPANTLVRARPEPCNFFKAQDAAVNHAHGCTSQQILWYDLAQSLAVIQRHRMQLSIVLRAAPASTLVCARPGACNKAQAQDAAVNRGQSCCTTALV